MPLVNLDAEEAAVIQTLRDARQSPEKNDSRSIEFNNQTLKIHVFRQETGRWVIRIIVKRE